MQITKVIVHIRNHLNRREKNIVEIFIKKLLENKPFEYIVDNVEAFQIFNTE